MGQNSGSFVNLDMVGFMDTHPFNYGIIGIEPSQD